MGAARTPTAVAAKEETLTHWLAQGPDEEEEDTPEVELPRADEDIVEWGQRDQD